MSEWKSVRLETVARGDNTVFRYGVVRLEPEATQEQYDVGLEIKTQTPGDSKGGGRGALDEAVTQALRGASGLINAISERQDDGLMRGTTSARIVPVVITTATLVTFDTDLSKASLSAGELPGDIVFTPRTWLWLRTRPSAHLRHHAAKIPAAGGSLPASDTFGALADRDYARSVGIVSADGLRAFLNAANVHVGV